MGQEQILIHSISLASLLIFDPVHPLTHLADLFIRPIMNWSGSNSHVTCPIAISKGMGSFERTVLLLGRVSDGPHERKILLQKLAVFSCEVGETMDL